VLLHWLGCNVYVPFNNDDQRYGVSTAETTTADAAAFRVASEDRSR